MGRSADLLSRQRPLPHPCGTARNDGSSAVVPMQSRPPAPDASDTVLVDLGDGLRMRVQVAAGETPRGEVATRGGGGPSPGKAFSLDGAFEAIRALSRRLGSVLREVKPSKASVTYGLEMEVHDGALLATLVRGGGTTSLEVTLEWEPAKDG